MERNQNPKVRSRSGGYLITDKKPSSNADLRGLNIRGYLRLRQAAFTLIELLIGFAVFSLLLGLVLTVCVGVSRSVRRAEMAIAKEQKQRFCLARLGREASSALSPESGGFFEGGENRFFFLLLKTNRY